MWIINHVYNILLPSLIIILSISVVLFNNPIYSLLALIIVFFQMVILLLSIQVEFLSMIFLIIYIGAISILFLFVIMMFNLKELQTAAKPHNFTISAYIFLFFFGPKFYFIINNVIQKHLLYHQTIANEWDFFEEEVFTDFNINK